MSGLVFEGGGGETTAPTATATGSVVPEADLEDGFSAAEVFARTKGCGVSGGGGGGPSSYCGYTYDDVIILPGHIDFGVRLGVSGRG